MSSAPPERRRSAHDRGRAIRRRRRFAIAAIAVAIFAIGIAFGEALHDNPVPGKTTTSEQTIDPGSLSTTTLETTTASP